MKSKNMATLLVLLASISIYLYAGDIGEKSLLEHGFVHEGSLYVHNNISLRDLCGLLNVSVNKFAKISDISCEYFYGEPFRFPKYKLSVSGIDVFLTVAPEVTEIHPETEVEALVNLSPIKIYKPDKKELLALGFSEERIGEIIQVFKKENCKFSEVLNMFHGYGVKAGNFHREEPYLPSLQKFFMRIGDAVVGVSIKGKDKTQELEPDVLVNILIADSFSFSNLDWLGYNMAKYLMDNGFEYDAKSEPWRIRKNISLKDLCSIIECKPTDFKPSAKTPKRYFVKSGSLLCEIEHADVSVKAFNENSIVNASAQEDLNIISQPHTAVTLSHDVLLKNGFVPGVSLTKSKGKYFVKKRTQFEKICALLGLQPAEFTPALTYPVGSPAEGEEWLKSLGGWTVIPIQSTVDKATCKIWVWPDTCGNISGLEAIVDAVVEFPPEPSANPADPKTPPAPSDK